MEHGHAAERQNNACQLLAFRYVIAVSLLGHVYVLAGWPANNYIAGVENRIMKY